VTRCHACGRELERDGYRVVFRGRAFDRVDCALDWPGALGFAGPRQAADPATVDALKSLRRKLDEEREATRLLLAKLEEAWSRLASSEGVGAGEPATASSEVD
jgi:hypothetical protein